jgi:hypothetical protein
MDLINLPCSRIAAAAITMATIISPTNAQSTTEDGKNALALATKQNNLIFIVYMILLALVLIATYLLWKSGNSVQEAIRKDADARIEEAKRGVKQLEANNLTLTGDLETEKGKVANLQKDAANAKAAQQKVEIELSEQQERTAKAEKNLLEVRKRQNPRNIDGIDFERLKQYLVNKPKSPVIISCVYGDQEGCTFAEQIKSVFVASGWNVSGAFPRVLKGSPSGVALHIPSGNKNMPAFPDPLPAAVPTLIDAFRDVLGIELDRRFPFLMSLPSDTVEIFVGYK